MAYGSWGWGVLEFLVKGSIVHLIYPFDMFFVDVWINPRRPRQSISYNIWILVDLILTVRLRKTTERPPSNLVGECFANQTNYSHAHIRYSDWPVDGIAQLVGGWSGGRSVYERGVPSQPHEITRKGPSAVVASNYISSKITSSRLQ